MWKLQTFFIARRVTNFTFVDACLKIPLSVDFVKIQKPILLLSVRSERSAPTSF